MPEVFIINLRLLKSLSIDCRTPGNCTLIATISPDLRVALWTCPMEAAANGLTSKCLKFLNGLKDLSTLN